MSNVNTARAFSGVHNDRISYSTPPVWGHGRVGTSAPAMNFVMKRGLVGILAPAMNFFMNQEIQNAPKPAPQPEHGPKPAPSGEEAPLMFI